MSPVDRETALRRNVQLYPAYVAARDAMFWMPVFFLFFSDYLPLESVLRIEAIYYTAIVITEIPSGYFSDRVGRRWSLLISSAMLLGAHGLFFVAPVIVDSARAVFALFAVAQVMLAAGFAFNSGTDASFHFDSLAALGSEGDYANREAVASRNSFLASATAAFIGGLAASVDLRYAYALSFGAAAVSFVLVLKFIEPTGQPGEPADAESSSPGGLLRQILHCLGYLRQPVLAWLFAFGVTMVMLNHVPYEFYQPYIRLVFEERALRPSAAPMTAGTHMALTMLAGSWFAARSVKLRDRVGLTAALLLAAAVQLLLIGSMAFVLSGVVVALVLLRTAPRALMTAPLNAAVTPRIEKQHRATYLSIQNLTGRLAFSLLLLGLASVVGEPLAWDQLSHMLVICFVVGLSAIALLVVMSRASRRS